MGRFLFLIPAAISEVSKVHLPFSWAVERQAAHMGKWTRSAKVLGLRLEPLLQDGHQTKYWLLWKKDSPGCHEEGGAMDTAHPRGHWAICKVNSAPVVIWPSNNVHLSDPGYNLPHSCVALRAFLFSPHLEEIFFILRGASTFLKLSFLMLCLCSESGFGKQRWEDFSFSSSIFVCLFVLVNKRANAYLVLTIGQSLQAWPLPPHPTFRHLRCFLPVL